MNVPRILTFNNNVPKTKKRHVLEASAIAGTSTVIGLGTYGIIDTFTERKSYKKIIKQEKADFYSGLVDKLNSEIKNLGHVPEAEEKAELWKTIKSREIDIYNNKMELLQDLRFSRLKKHLKVSAGIGFCIGVIAAAAKYFYEKKHVQSSTKTIEPAKTPYPPFKLTSSHVMVNGKIPFTGIIDKLSDQMTEDDRKNIQDYINGEWATPDELAMARRIGGYRLNRDWPKGLNEHNRYLYGIDDGISIRQKPQTDKDYQMIILKQEIVVPDEPPQYYRNYDKWFNTERWQKYQTWSEYSKQAMKFERMETLINKARLEIYAEERAAAELATKKQLAAACIKYQINQEFLIDFNSDNKKVKIPNAIMIIGKDNKETEETIKWLVGKSNSNYTFIEDKNDSNETRLNQILTVLERAQDNYEKNGKRTLIWVENFDKLLSNSVSNEDVVADLKDLLGDLSKTYKTTIVFNCRDTKKLNPITIQPHRVKKYNIDREVTNEEFERLQDNLILSSVSKIKNSDGYRYKYIPFDNEHYVDLFLGDFGHTSSILWVETQKTDAINEVIKNIKVLKTIPKFKDVRTIKFPRPNNLKEINSNNLRCTGNITTDGKVIYEYKI